MNDRWIPAVLLGAVLATGCGDKAGENARKAEQTAAAPATVAAAIDPQVDVSRADRAVLALPSAPLVHWNVDDVRTLGYPKQYAEHPVAALTGPDDGSWTFHPATDRDHFATPYVPVPSTASERWVAVQVKGSPAAAVNCVLHVQNQKFENLGDVPCDGDQTKNGVAVTISLPASATSVRMYLADPQLKPIVLPRDITVMLYSRDAAAAAATGQH